jgi:Tfp pilus assembly protein FimV
MAIVYRADEAGFHGKQRYRISLGNYDDAYEKALGDLESMTQNAYRVVSRMTPRERINFVKYLRAKVEAMPPVQRQMFDRIRRRQMAGKWTPRTLSSGLGALSWVDTAANIAQIGATVAAVGVSIYSLQEQRKARKAQEGAQARQNALEEQLFAQEMQEREAEQKRKQQLFEVQMAQLKQQQAASQAAQAGTHPRAAVVSVPAEALPQQQAAGGVDKKTLLYGGVAAAGLVAATMLAK